jgi:hypothetical protein
MVLSPLADLIPLVALAVCLAVAVALGLVLWTRSVATLADADRNK